MPRLVTVGGQGACWPFTPLSSLAAWCAHRDALFLGSVFRGLAVKRRSCPERGCVTWDDI